MMDDIPGQYLAKGADQIKIGNAVQFGGEPPAPRSGHVACCLDGHRVLVHGGWDPRANDAEGDGELGPEIWDDLLILDTRTWSWSRPRAVHGAAPSPRTGHTLVPCGGALYLFGGLGETEVLGDSYVLVPRGGAA